MLSWNSTTIRGIYVHEKNDNHNVVFFVPVGVIIAADDEGVTHPCGHLSTLTPLCRRKGRDPSLLKLQSNEEDKDNDVSIASSSKNNKDHMWSLLGLQMVVELPA